MSGSDGVLKIYRIDYGAGSLGFGGFFYHHRMVRSDLFSVTAKGKSLTFLTEGRNPSPDKRKPITHLLPASIYPMVSQCSPNQCR